MKFGIGVRQLFVYLQKNSQKCRPLQSDVINWLFEIAEWKSWNWKGQCHFTVKNVRRIFFKVAGLCGNIVASFLLVAMVYVPALRADEKLSIFIETLIDSASLQSHLHFLQALALERLDFSSFLPSRFYPRKVKKNLHQFISPLIFI